jgi:hypothetical protein
MIDLPYMNDLEVRRLFITDEEWNRTSSSWKDLKPLRNFNHYSEKDETSEECDRRLLELGYEIPYAVIDQWIYPHYYNHNMVNNYGWMDYRKALFLETTLSVDQLRQLYVIEDFRDYVQRRSTSNPYGDFTCSPKDLEHWKTYGTWRVPPIVLDVESISGVPSFAEISGPYQLIEGHTRLGYLLSLINVDMLRVREHRVFLLHLGE